jgi:hypothetical protein
MARMESRRENRGPTDRPIVKSADSARQAVTGHNVRYVLGFGLAGVVLAFGVIYALSFTWH